MSSNERKIEQGHLGADGNTRNNRSLHLYEGIGEIDEDLIAVALSQNTEGQKSLEHDVAPAQKSSKTVVPVWRKVLSLKPLRSLAACLCICVVGALAMNLLGIFPRHAGKSGGEAGEGTTYMSYQGPVMAMTAVNPAASSYSGTTFDNVVVSRSLNFDFASYETSASKSEVTDIYSFTNNSEEERTLLLRYPFVERLATAISRVPTIHVDGKLVNTELRVGTSAGSFTSASGSAGDDTLNLENPDSWEGYKALIEAGYEQTASGTYPELKQKVTVYEVTDIRSGENTDAAAPTLELSYSYDSTKTRILTYGFNGYRVNEATGTSGSSFFLPEEGAVDYGQSKYLILLGADVAGYELQGYVDGACEEKLDGLSATVTRYECTLEEVLAKVLALYLHDYYEQYDEASHGFLKTLSEEMLQGLAAEYLESVGIVSVQEDGSVVSATNGSVASATNGTSATLADRYLDGRLEEVLGDAYTTDRIMYQDFALTIPANSTVVVKAQMEKPASIDFTGEARKRNGYDMVPTLGSILTCQSQEASVSNYDNIEILDQNFGFDLEQGIDQVTLDQTVEHYYMNIQKKETK